MREALYAALLSIFAIFLTSNAALAEDTSGGFSAGAQLGAVIGLDIAEQLEAKRLENIRIAGERAVLDQREINTGGRIEYSCSDFSGRFSIEEMERRRQYLRNRTIVGYKSAEFDGYSIDLYVDKSVSRI